MPALDYVNKDGTIYEIVPEIAPLFNTSTAYAVGDCVIKDAVLYRFKIAHAAGAWVGTDAEAIEVGEELTYFGNKITNLKQDYSQLLNSAYVTETITDTAVASFTDGADGVPVKSLTVDVEPVQDLHGYDHPWPGGGSKNKLVYPYYSSTPQTSNGLTYTANSDGSITVNGTATANTVYTMHLVMDLADGEYILSGGKSVYKYLGVGYFESDSAETATRINNKTGGGVSFTSHKGTLSYPQLIINSGQTCNNEVFYPMIRPSSVSDDTFVPYSNICPISGRTGAKVTRTGKNLVDIQDYSNTAVSSITTETTPKFASIPYKENTQYTLSANVVIDSSRAFGIVVVYTNGTYEYLWLSMFGTVVSHVTTASNKTVSSMVFAYDAAQTVTSLTNVMVEEGSTASAYEPFGTVYSIDLDGTVYGGTLDVVNGVLTVDRASVDLGTLNWGYSSAYGFYSTGLTGFKYPSSEATPANILCSARKTSAWNDLSTYGKTGNNIAVTNSGSTYYVGITDNTTTSTADFKAAISGTQLVYELATPVTIQLTPTEVTTLLLNNNIFADCGNVNELTYRADLKAYIDSVIS